MEQHKLLGRTGVPLPARRDAAAKRASRKVVLHPDLSGIAKPAKKKRKKIATEFLARQAATKGKQPRKTRKARKKSRWHIMTNDYSFDPGMPGLNPNDK